MIKDKSHITLSFDKKAQPLLHSAAYVVARADYVSIDLEALKNLVALNKFAEVCRQNSANSFTDTFMDTFADPFGDSSATSYWLESAPTLVKDYFTSLTLENRIQFLMIFHTIGFCYWGEPRWKYSQYDGAMALLVSMAINQDFRNLDYLASLNPEQFKSLLAGEFSENIDSLALLRERHEFIVSLAQKLRSENYLHALLPLLATTSGIDLALKFAHELPGYLDIAHYKGKEILFLKRAQLLVSDINHALVVSGASEITKIDELTAFADYKLPQLLRHYQVLAYEPALATRVDQRSELEPGSEEEVEIRAATLIAVELIRHELQKKGIRTSAAAIDSILWQLSQKLDKARVKPYHRCKTVFY